MKDDIVKLEGMADHEKNGVYRVGSKSGERLRLFPLLNTQFATGTTFGGVLRRGYLTRNCTYRNGNLIVSQVHSTESDGLEFTTDMFVEVYVPLVDRAVSINYTSAGETIKATVYRDVRKKLGIPYSVGENVYIATGALCDNMGVVTISEVNKNISF